MINVNTSMTRRIKHPFDSFIISKTPAGRWGATEDLAGPAVFLASEASDLVNGHILYVDGGIPHGCVALEGGVIPDFFHSMRKDFVV